MSKEASKTDTKRRQRPKEEKPAKKEFKLPAEGFVNKYHFMRISPQVLEKLGWPTDVQVNVTLDISDGALIVRKAA